LRFSPPSLAESQGGGRTHNCQDQRQHSQDTSHDRSHPSNSSFQVDGGETDVADGDQSRKPKRGRARSASLASRVTEARDPEQCNPCDKPDDRTGGAAGRVREHCAARGQEFRDVSCPRQRDSDQGNECALCRAAREGSHLLIVP
jgi:hypothetical protein